MPFPRISRRPVPVTFMASILCLLMLANSATAQDRANLMPITTTSAEARQLYLEGIKYVDSWQLTDAEPLFERALELDPNFVLAVVGLAWSQPQFKKMFALGVRAEKMLETVEVSEGERLKVRAFAAILNTDNQTWLAHKQKIVELYPDDPRCRIELSQAIFNVLRDNEAGVTEIREAIRLDPEFPKPHELLAGYLWSIEEYEAARESYQRFIDLDPENPSGYDSYGHLLIKLGQYQAAIDSYGEALSRDPMYEASHLGIGTALMLLDKHGAARQHLRSLLADSPNDGIRSGLHFALSVVYADEGRLEEALRELELNYGVSASSYDFIAMRIDLLNASKVLMELKRFDDLSDRLNKALQICVDDPNQGEQRKEFLRIGTGYQLAVVDVARGNVKDAVAALEELRERTEPLVSGQMNRVMHDLEARIAMAEGRHWDAIHAFMKANSGDAYTMFRMAQSFDALGKPEKVREMLTYVVEYRGVMNLNYAFVRRKAEAWLAELDD